ncbi:MAG TPA: type IV pilus modification protein PilV [Chromatiales bacterium]|nr:type IV pilus modification protein PilV [Thiotrichales bacterium]HIP69318.1 type IV pilus modification protein PilV [Chromatiales bacterium]
MQTEKLNFPDIRPKETGFTLVEMLVAVVVLSVGLLGLASLQANSLKMNDSAYYRTQATYLGYDILERMRANRAAAITNSYNVTSGFTPPTGSSVEESDLREWDNLVRSLLPSGQGSIACDAAGVGLCTITISWNDSRAATNTEANTKTITLNTQI